MKSKRRKVQVWAYYENLQFLTSVIEEEAGSRVTNDDPEPEGQHLSGNDSIYNSTLVVVDDNISADSNEHNGRTCDKEKAMTPMSWQQRKQRKQKSEEEGRKRQDKVIAMMERME